MYAAAIVLLSILQLAPGYPMNPSPYVSPMDQNRLSEHLERGAQDIMKAVEESEGAARDNNPALLQEGLAQLDEYWIRTHPANFPIDFILIYEALPHPDFEGTRLDVAWKTWDYAKKLAFCMLTYLKNPGTELQPDVLQFIKQYHECGFPLNPAAADMRQRARTRSAAGRAFTRNENLLPEDSEGNLTWPPGFESVIRAPEHGSAFPDGYAERSDRRSGVQPDAGREFERLPSFNHYIPSTSIAPSSTSERDRTTEQNNDDITEYRGGWQF
ncbi:hypothetical protein SeMB42_g05230 [Synchytrium endobioticum]|uniref:Uncharacterized protein n=1 Tax=Synchytrium endobioticum TaxID=286115 RepID=A0A507BYS3_9FUNG|nr:hypothetical protein SeLEV6574_g08283 [Synchytrium endobioticum]TPX34441.1 hypothetical protein SeLEV6574_g08282 [Synchytrium endobioticum]TPX42226.1 hypothetical protein SeMB42_g05230 [Synchytrium endobioticum]TPX47260.1 hypothetical protein SeLEV6574_g02753 [Synchytrium endobioticum]